MSLKKQSSGTKSFSINNYDDLSVKLCHCWDSTSDGSLVSKYEFIAANRYNFKHLMSIPNERDKCPGENQNSPRNQILSSL